MPSDAQVLSQISSGIDYLHKKGYAHGQLNPHAILISQSHPVQMKVSDFGLCKFIKKNLNLLLSCPSLIL
jgi:serine/threonine protein kinase